MELSEIRYFLALAETLNFTKAAERSHVSQPALTRAIRKMEDELGGLLFSRERKNTHLTELGQLIHPHLAEVAARTGAVEQTAARFLKLEQAHLEVGVMCTIAPVQFVSFLSRFRADHPGIELTLSEAVPERLSEMLLNGDLDVAIMARPDGFPAPLQVTELYRERFVIACSAGHRFAREAAVPMTALDGEFYLSRINCEFTDHLAELVRAQQINLVRAYRSEREDWILTLVAAGLGVCFLPEFTAAFPGVVGCPFVDPAVERTVGLVTVAGRRASPPLHAFTNAIRHYPWPITEAPPRSAG